MKEGSGGGPPILMPSFYGRIKDEMLHSREIAQSAEKVELDMYIIIRRWNEKSTKLWAGQFDHDVRHIRLCPIST